MKKRKRNKVFLWSLIFVVGIVIAFNVGKASISSGVFHDMQSLETTSGSGTSVDSDSDGIIDKAEALDDSGSAKDYDDIVNDAKVGSCFRILAYATSSGFYNGTGDYVLYSTTSDKAKTKVPEICFNRWCRLVAIRNSDEYHRSASYIQYRDSSMLSSSENNIWLNGTGGGINGDSTYSNVFKITGSGKYLRDDGGAESNSDEWSTNNKLNSNSEVWVCG